MTKAIIVRNDNTLSPAGLKLVEKLAAEGKTQRYIASQLSMPLKTFEKMLERGKGSNPERLSWERGHAMLEQRASDRLQSDALGDVVELEELGEDGQPIIDETTGEAKKVRVQVPTTKGHIIALLYFTKARLGWTEKPTGAMVQDNRIQITLPKATSLEEFYKKLNITGPLDFRTDKSKSHPLLKDVTPPRPAGALPAPAEEKPPKGESS